MNSGKKYLYSLLSLLCIAGWVVLVFAIFYSETSERWVMAIPLTYAITIAAGVIGSSILILVRTIRRRRLKYTFIYNLLGTLNLLAGFIGLAWSTSRIEQPMYIIAASFALGLYIYYDIYFKKNIPA